MTTNSKSYWVIVVPGTLHKLAPSVFTMTQWRLGTFITSTLWVSSLRIERLSNVPKSFHLWSGRSVQCHQPFFATGHSSFPSVLRINLGVCLWETCIMSTWYQSNCWKTGTLRMSAVNTRLCSITCWREALYLWAQVKWTALNVWTKGESTPTSTFPLCWARGVLLL